MPFRNRVGISILLILFLVPTVTAHSSSETDDDVTLTIIGRVVNTQGAAVDESKVVVFMGGEQRRLKVAGQETTSVYTDTTGFYFAEMVLPLSLVESEMLAVEISKTGFRTTYKGFAQQKIACADDNCYIRIPDVVLSRIFNQAFFLATAFVESWSRECIDTEVFSSDLPKACLKGGTYHDSFTGMHLQKLYVSQYLVINDLNCIDNDTSLFETRTKPNSPLTAHIIHQLISASRSTQPS